MLVRQLEREVMDGPDTAIAYDQMDHARVNQAFVDDMLSCCFSDGDAIEGDFLDLGTGTAQIPILLCQQAPNVRVMAVDLGESMLHMAGANVDVASLRDRICVDRVDAKQLPYPESTFDVTMSNSLVHHLPEPFGALQEAVRVTKPGGHLFFRDLLRPDSKANLEKLVASYAGDESQSAQTMFRESLHAALTIEEVRQWTSELGLAESHVAASSDRHWTWSARRS